MHCIVAIRCGGGRDITALLLRVLSSGGWYGGNISA